MTLSNVQARDTWGDGVYLGHSTHTARVRRRRLQCPQCLGSRGPRSSGTGGRGSQIVDAENVTLQGYPRRPLCAGERGHRDRRRLRDSPGTSRSTGNQFGAHLLGVVASVGYGADPQVGDLTVTDNVQTVPASFCFAPVRILSPVDGTGQILGYRKGYVFRRNQFRGTRNGLSSEESTTLR